MKKFTSGLIAGIVTTAAGAYLLVKNKDKGHIVVRESREVLEKAEDYLDKAEKNLM